MAYFDRVIVIGAGGTGSFLLPGLIRYLYSVEYEGTIIIADGDKYSESNMGRQNFLAKYVGMNKAEYQGNILKLMVPDMSDRIQVLDKYLTKEDIEEIVVENTVVINCVDNKAARKYVEDRCDKLRNAVHICCGNEMNSGQVQVSAKYSGERVTPSIYDLIPDLDSSNDDRSVMSCEDMANLPGGGQLITANMTAATLALNYFTQLYNHMFPFGDGYITSGITWFDSAKNSFLVEQQTPIPQNAF